MANKKNHGDYDEWLVTELKGDPEQQIEYLRSSLEDNSMPEVFLSALKNVAKARGISNLADETGLNRENLYKMLSENGNPELRSMYKVLDALGFRLSVELKDEPQDEAS